MAIEAPLSKYKKQSFLIWMALFIGAAAWFGYDGYLNKGFQEKHTITNEKGEKVPDSDLEFNRKWPPYFLGAGLVIGAIFLAVRGKKIVADETCLIMGKKTIPYDSIEKIDKTLFDTKGFFIVTYKDGDKEAEVKLSKWSYDNMPAILDELVKQIS